MYFIAASDRFSLRNNVAFTRCHREARGTRTYPKFNINSRYCSPRTFMRDNRPNDLLKQCYMPLSAVNKKKNSRIMRPESTFPFVTSFHLQ